VDKGKGRAKRAKAGLTPFKIMTYNQNTGEGKEGKPSFAPLPHTLRVGARAKGKALAGGRVVFFDVLGEPKPTPRGRAVNAGKHARIYTPATADAWKHDVRAGALDAIAGLGGWKLIAPGVAAEVYLGFRFERPRSHFRTGRFSGMLKPGAPSHHTQTPDKDNLEKAVLDALTEFDDMPPLFWCDDCQVDDGRTSKRWADPGEKPGVAVAILEILEC
jgi:Holliday junction resolvase RusA-like endonuclease